MALLGTDKILQQEIEIHCSQHGRFSIKTPGDNGTELGAGETLDSAKRAAGATIRARRVKIRVDFVTDNGERGFVYALHGRGRGYMAEIDGAKQQFDSYKTLRGDIPQARLDELQRLKDESKRIGRSIRNIETEYRLDLRQAVDQAIDAARETQG